MSTPQAAGASKPDNPKFRLTKLSRTLLPLHFIGTLLSPHHPPLPISYTCQTSLTLLTTPTHHTLLRAYYTHLLLLFRRTTTPFLLARAKSASITTCITCGSPATSLLTHFHPLLKAHRILIRSALTCNDQHCRNRARAYLRNALTFDLTHGVELLNITVILVHTPSLPGTTRANGPSTTSWLTKPIPARAILVHDAGLMDQLKARLKKGQFPPGFFQRHGGKCGACGGKAVDMHIVLAPSLQNGLVYARAMPLCDPEGTNGVCEKKVSTYLSAKAKEDHDAAKAGGFVGAWKMGDVGEKCCYCTYRMGGMVQCSCKTVWYCSEECRVAFYPGHKAECHRVLSPVKRVMDRSKMAAPRASRAPLATLKAVGGQVKVGKRWPGIGRRR